jgi:hypothetical protein
MSTINDAYSSSPLADAAGHLFGGNRLDLAGSEESDLLVAASSYDLILARAA